MKVKNIFANRKSKKKKASTSDDKINNVLKTQNFNNSSEALNNHPQEVKIICDTSEVRLRRNQPSKQLIDRNIKVTSTASTISSNSSQSTKSRPPRSRPWSFIDQFRRQDSKETSDYDDRNIENLKRNLVVSNSTPGTAFGSQNNLDVEPTLISLKPHGSPASTHSSGISTLPRRPRAEAIDENTPRNSPSTFNHREGNDAAAYIRDLHGRPKSTAGFEFRLFNFFRKTTPYTPAYNNLYNTQGSVDSSDPDLSSTGRSSFRGKKSKSKKKKNKKRESGGSQRSNISYDSESMRINETTIHSDITYVEDKRVPDNGDIVLLESDTLKHQILVNRHTQIEGVTTTSSNDANVERSSSNNSTGSKRGITITRFPSTSTSSSDRSSCNIRQSRNSVMFEEFVHTYPSNNSETEIDSAQAGLHSSLSASNIGNAKRQGILKKASSMDGEVENACAGRSVQIPSDDRVEQMMYLDSVVPDLTSNPPTKAELEDIAFPGVMLRKNRSKARPRPLSAYATNRPAHVTSLQLDELPTYSRIRYEMGNYHTESMENILDNQIMENSGISSSMSTNNVRYGHTSLSMRTPSGYSSASVGNFESLNTYGSKQYLGDMDEDEKLNALLGSTKSHPTILKLSLQQEPSSKRARTIRKSVVSLANLISPGKPSRGKLQRSSSFKETATTSSSANNITFKPYRPPGNTPRKAKDRRSQLWCETFDHAGLTEKHIKWQEAIYELFQGERDLVQDLTMANKTYCDSMVTLKMLSDDIVNLIFGKLDCLLPLHEQLVQKLEEARGDDGRTHAVGHIFLEWLPSISLPYREYCANQADAKDALDAAIDADKRVKDFLQRCLESPFSRKLDLWSYLDLPRTRLVKYPLLLKNTLKRTPNEFVDEIYNLEKALAMVSEIIEKVDETTGEQQCRYIRSKLEYLDEKQRSPFVDDSKTLLLQGQLKNNRGTKMVVFIFEQAVVLTRSVTRSEKHSFQVYRQPVPMRSLILDAQSDAEKSGGSFRGGILNSDKLKHAFRLKSDEIGTSYTLQANDEHDRKLWVNALQEAQTKYRLKHSDYSFNDPSSSSQGFVQRRRATYDITLNAHKKGQLQARRTSSEKGNVTATVREETSTETVHGLSISNEEDPGLILSSNDADVGLLWSRNRSNTAAPNMMSSPKVKSKSDKKYLNEGAKPKKFFNNSSNQPTIVVEESQGKLFKKSSRRPQRHVSLTGADNWISKQKTKSSKIKESISRSRSLTGSPQSLKGVLSVNRLTHLSGNNLPSPNKPPTGRPASPYNLRSSPGLHNSRTAPDLQKTSIMNKIKPARGSNVRRSVSDIQNRQKQTIPMRIISHSARNSRTNSECDSLNTSNSNNLLLLEEVTSEIAFIDSIEISTTSTDLIATVEDLTAGSVDSKKKSNEDASAFDSTLKSMDMCDVTLTESDVMQEDASTEDNNNIVREDASKQNVRELNKEKECLKNENLIEYMADADPKDSKFPEQNHIVECISPSHGLTKCREEIKVVDEIFNCNLQTSI